MYSHTKSSDDVVSIVMPCYNAEAFVDEAIASVVNQTWQFWELLVVDDGSSDCSLEIARSWAKRDSRIKCFSNERNLGVSKTRNRGIDIAVGNWLAFLDSDDVWEPTKLLEQMSLINRVQGEFAFTGCSFIDESGTILGQNYHAPNVVTLNQLKHWNSIICSSVLVKRESIGKNRFERDETREDYLFWLKVLAECKAAYGVEAPLIKYRVLPQSRSSNKTAMVKATYLTHRSLGTDVIRSSFQTASHFLHAFYRKYRKVNR